MLEIKLKNNSPEEQKIRNILVELVEANPILQKILFTEDILIEEGVIPRSHPILTLGTRFVLVENPNILLSTFIHEQMHWYVETLGKKVVDQYIKDLKKRYPKLPVGYPRGAKTEFSSYLHMIVNFLELDILKQIVSESEYHEVLEFYKNDHYTELYEMIERDMEELETFFSDIRISLNYNSAKFF